MKGGPGSKIARRIDLNLDNARGCWITIHVNLCVTTHLDPQYSPSPQGPAPTSHSSAPIDLLKAWPTRTAATALLMAAGHWSQHNGADIGGVTGDPVTDVLDGAILSAQSCPFFGNTVVVYHGAKPSTVYAHLDSLAVGPDGEVEAGRLVGAMGSTGRTTGPRLPFEARIDGTARDSEPFLP